MPKLVKKRQRVQVRESTPVEEAMDDLLVEAEAAPTRPENEADRISDEDWILELEEWRNGISELANELRWQIKLSQANSQVIRRFEL